MKRRSYGTHPDVPDVRDHYFKCSLARLPASTDLRPHFPAVYEQGTLNSCSANALAAILWYEERRVNPHATSPSRLFIYFNERRREHRVAKNVPVSLRDGYKSVVKTGACIEDLWPYVVTNFREKPHRRCYDEARTRRVVSYARVHRKLDALRGCLASGQPFTLGISVHESFEGEHARKTGRLSLPRRGERLLGGHAVVAVGFHDESQRFILRNSWGRKWGLEGYFTLPYEYLLHESLAWDFWTVRSVSIDQPERQ